MDTASDVLPNLYPVSRSSSGRCVSLPDALSVNTRATCTPLSWCAGFWSKLVLRLGMKQVYGCQRNNHLIGPFLSRGVLWLTKISIIWKKKPSPSWSRGALRRCKKHGDTYNDTEAGPDILEAACNKAESRIKRKLIRSSVTLPRFKEILSDVYFEQARAEECRDCYMKGSEDK